QFRSPHPIAMHPKYGLKESFQPTTCSLRHSVDTHGPPTVAQLYVSRDSRTLFLVVLGCSAASAIKKEKTMIAPMTRFDERVRRSRVQTFCPSTGRLVKHPILPRAA